MFSLPQIDSRPKHYFQYCFIFFTSRNLCLYYFYLWLVSPCLVYVLSRFIFTMIAFTYKQQKKECKTVTPTFVTCFFFANLSLFLTPSPFNRFHPTKRLPFPKQYQHAKLNETSCQTSCRTTSSGSLTKGARAPFASLFRPHQYKNIILFAFFVPPFFRFTFRRTFFSPHCVPQVRTHCTGGRCVCLTNVFFSSQDNSFLPRPPFCCEMLHSKWRVFFLVGWFVLSYLNRLKILENELLLQLKNSLKIALKNSIYLR